MEIGKKLCQLNSILTDQILLGLKKYLEIKILYRIDMVFDADRTLVKGTQSGLMAKINRSKADIGVTSIMIEKYIEEVDFCYPFVFEDYTIFTRKPR